MPKIPPNKTARSFLLAYKGPGRNIRFPVFGSIQKRKDETQMSTTAVVAGDRGQVSLVKRMATAYGVDDSKFYSMIVTTIFPSKVGEKTFTPTQEMVMAFLVICEQYDLNPILREIYPFIDSNGNLRVIVGIDGWIKHVQRHQQFDGHEFIDHMDANKTVYATTCKIYRKDRARAVEMTEYMAECRRDTGPWKQWPLRMLKHKAFIQASRYAFGMSGLEDEDDFDRSITVQTVAPPVEHPRRLSETSGANVTPPPAAAAAEPDVEKVEKEQSKASTAEPLDESQVKEIWKIGMNRGLVKVDITNLLKQKFGVDRVQGLSKHQYEDAINWLIGAPKP